MVRELGSIDNPVLSLGPFFVEIGTGAPASSGGRDDKVRPSITGFGSHNNCTLF